MMNRLGFTWCERRICSSWQCLKKGGDIKKTWMIQLSWCCDSKNEIKGRITVMRYFSAVAMILALLVVADLSYAASKKKELKDITLTGTITKVEKKIKEKTSVTYVLTDKDGNKVNLPKPKAKGEEKAINLDDYVDAKVKLVGKGTETVRREKKTIRLSSIVSIEKVVEKDVEMPAEDVGEEDLDW